MIDHLVLDQKETPAGLLRQRVRPGGAQYVTIEIPVQVWNGINRQGRAGDRYNAWVRARVREDDRREARKLHTKGRTAAEITAHLGVPRRTVNRWLKGAR